MRANVDTDAIIPSREIKKVGKTGLAEGLFAGWRYRGIGTRDVDPEFVLNKPQYACARILLGGENFGCGSSREHAVWALHEYGFRAIVASSFAPIFFGNCVRNGVLPATLAGDSVAQLAVVVEAAPTRNLVTVDLERCEVSAPGAAASSPPRSGARVYCELPALMVPPSSGIFATNIGVTPSINERHGSLSDSACRVGAVGASLSRTDPSPP